MKQEDLDVLSAILKASHAPKALLLLIPVILCITLGKGSALCQTYQPNEEIDTLRVSGNVYMLRSNAKKGNPNAAASIGEDGVLLIDASFASFAGKVLAKLRQLGGRDVRFVFNTHWHGDHTGGDEFFGPVATIISRSNTRKRLLTQNILDDNGRLLAKRGLPIITFDNNLSLYFNGEEIKVLAPPNGHTDGDAIVYFTQSNVLCVGDYFFVNRFPVIDVAESGADLKGYLSTMKFIIDHYPSDVRIIPGHSDFFPVELKVSDMNDYRSYYNMLLESIDFVRREIKDGKSLEEIQKEGLPEKFRKYEERPRFVPAIKWIETIYRSLQSAH